MYVKDSVKAVIIAVIVITIAGSIFSLAIKTDKNQENVRKLFCNSTIVFGSGRIDYCGGKPFVCGFDNGIGGYICNWVERPVIGEECRTTMVGAVSTRHCEEVLE